MAQSTDKNRSLTTIPMILVLACASCGSQNHGSNVASESDLKNAAGNESAADGDRPSEDQPTKTVDLTKAAQDKVAAYGVVPVTITTMVDPHTETCTPRPGQVNNGPADRCQPDPKVAVHNTSLQLLTVSNISIISNAPPQYGSGYQTALPDQAEVFQKTASNCSTEKATAHMAISVSTSHQEGVTLTNSVTHSNSYTIGLSAGPQWAKISASVTVGQSETNSTASMTSTTDTGSRTSTDDIPVSPQEKIIAAMTVIGQRYSIPFQTTVVIDGDLSANDKFKKLSDMFPKAEDRTFPVSGLVTTTNADDGTTIYMNGNFDPNECHGIDGISYSPQRKVPGSTVQDASAVVGRHNKHGVADLLYHKR